MISRLFNPSTSTLEVQVLTVKLGAVETAGIMAARETRRKEESIKYDEGTKADGEIILMRD